MMTVLSPTGVSAHGPPSLRDPLLLHETAALANLYAHAHAHVHAHAQTVFVQNVCTLVPLILDLTFGHYFRWHKLFLRSW